MSVSSSTFTSEPAKDASATMCISDVAVIPPARLGRTERADVLVVRVRARQADPAWTPPVRNERNSAYGSGKEPNFASLAVTRPWVSRPSPAGIG